MMYSKNMNEQPVVYSNRIINTKNMVHGILSTNNMDGATGVLQNYMVVHSNRIIKWSITTNNMDHLYKQKGLSKLSDQRQISSDEDEEDEQENR